ncbi:MAG: ABC-2 family transporter protein [Candidatus Hodarchaeota archaeon]
MRTVFSYKWDILLEYFGVALNLIVITICFGHLSTLIVIPTYKNDNLVLYYQSVALLSSLFSVCNIVTYQTWSDINSGELSGYLCRPIDYMYLNYINVLSSFLILLPIWALGTWLCIVLQSNNINFSFDKIAYLSFCIFLSLTLQYLIFFCIGVLSFYIKKSLSIRDFYFVFGIIFSGQLIPVDLLPNIMQKIANYLPFRHVFYSPIKILLCNDESLGNYTPVLFVQALWIFVFFVAARVLYLHGLTRYESQEIR